MMEILILVIIGIIFFLDKIFQIFFSPSQDKTRKNIYDDKTQDYIRIVDDFIRRECSFEVLKWITQTRKINSANTYDTTFISQLTNGEEVKKRVSIITNIISDKISPDLHGAFNRVYKKELEEVDKTSRIDINLREYIARYVFFMLRRLSYDLTVIIYDRENENKKMDDILKMYVINLEETVYKTNGIYLLDNNNPPPSE